MYFLAVLTSLFAIQYASALKDVTDKVFGSLNSGTLSAFGDFNADKHTDVFVVSEDGTSVFVYLADIEKEYSRVLLVNVSSGESQSSITSVVPVDLDGDLQMDILVTMETTTKQLSFYVYWGRAVSVDQKSPLQLPSLVDQPLVLDVNADMIPDLLGEKAPGERFYFIFSKDRNFTEVKCPGGNENGIHPSMRKPQSSAFVDLDNDLTADLCVVSMINETTSQLEFWLNKGGVLSLDKTVPVAFEKELKIIGQFAFVDLDGDLDVDILVPVCVDENCAESLVLLLYNNKWISLPVGLQYNGAQWGFVAPGSQNGFNLPITLRVGDFDLDGYPDLLAILVGNVSNHLLYRAVIFTNVDCGGSCEGFSRTFSVEWDTWLENSADKALLPAFYDLDDNGVLDVLVSSIDGADVPRLTVRQHQFVDDACFIKVMVVSGQCNYDCPNDRQPYGVNQPGPVIRYETTDLRGNLQQRAGTQLTQSAYSPLQLPYIVFGLGQTPNFVDTLQVGIPTNNTDPRNKKWTSIIPNSQLVVIPYPINDPTKWVNKLFVTPSRLMMLTGAALMGTCGFIAGIVGILHWRDKIEDRKEKRQEAQKFHFDAM